MIFSSQRFLQKKSKRILLYNYETSGRLVFFLFLEEIEGTKKTFRNYLTFSSVFFIHNGIFLKASLLCNSVIFVSMQSVCNISSKKKTKKREEREISHGTNLFKRLGQLFLELLLVLFVSNAWTHCSNSKTTSTKNCPFVIKTVSK